MRSSHRSTLLSFSLAAASLFGGAVLSNSLSGCGGGGGGGGEEFVGAATVNLSLQPSRIDSGDRTEVTVRIGEVHENGIALKLRFPDGLGYVPQSGVLFVNDEEIDVSPTYNVSSGKSGEIYLVFFLAQDLFREGGKDYNGEVGTLSLQLEGVSAVSDGSVEVDADVDDPREDNSTEFHVETPEFAAEDEAGIEVVD